MNQNKQNTRTKRRKLLVGGILTIAVSVCSWPVVYLWAAFRMLNNHDATTGEWALAYMCIYGPGVGVALGLAACIYASVQRNRSYEEKIPLSSEIKTRPSGRRGDPDV